MNRLSIFLLALFVMAGAACANWEFVDVTDQFDPSPRAASAVAWGDFDRDGDLDLFVGGTAHCASALYANDGNHYVDVTPYIEPPWIFETVLHAEFVDYDADGMLDLFVVTDGMESLRLFRQTSADHFENVPLTLGLDFTEPPRSTLWTDADGNGTLDLVLSNGVTSDAPMTVLAQEQSEFVEMRDNPFVDDVTGVGAMTLVDYDRDGDLDMFCGAFDPEEPPHFYRNENGVYRDWAQQFGFPMKLGRHGAVWLDYNNDQRLDLFVPGDAERTMLFRGAYVHGHQGLQPAQGFDDFLLEAADAVYAHAVDANMDGWTDLFVVKDQGRGCALFTNDSGRRWNNRAPALGLTNDRYDNRACAWGDMDGDGDLDLALAQGENGLKVYRNDVQQNHEYVVLNLMSHDGARALPNCDVHMMFQRCKQIATTSHKLSSAGSDQSSVLIVNTSTMKSSWVDLTIRWPNGIVSHYDQNDLTLWTSNTLYEPVLTQPAEPVTSADAEAPLVMSVGPNPFNPSTTISFSLLDAAEVSLSIYNLMGQEVATLARGPYAAGVHRVTFNAGELPSGIYLSRLTAGEATQVHRMLLTR